MVKFKVQILKMKNKNFILNIIIYISFFLIFWSNSINLINLSFPLIIFVATISFYNLYCYKKNNKSNIFYETLIATGVLYTIYYIRFNLSSSLFRNLFLIVTVGYIISLYIKFNKITNS